MSLYEVVEGLMFATNPPTVIIWTEEDGEIFRGDVADVPEEYEDREVDGLDFWTKKETYEIFAEIILM